MSKKEQRDLPDPAAPPMDTQRRDFLRGSVAAATGVAVTTTAGKAMASVAESGNEMKLKSAADKKDGYRLTKHISDYYKSAAI